MVSFTADGNGMGDGGLFLSEDGNLRGGENRRAHVHPDLGNLSVFHGEIQFFDPAFGGDTKMGFRNNSMIVHIFCHAADSVSAHGALEPSILYISISQSAVSDGLMRIRPSEPIPKWRSLTNFAVLDGSSTVSSKR